ncbi:MAG: hypothetical protein HY259_06485 [Chloroflexi bacterium]|nr:hypothetical protein [Chloroflexota bacterium]MBI3733090.1 hypothetical protein [Chloroflexota bacterium]
MIELAPNRKQGLTLANPIIAASGAAGFAFDASGLLALDRFGAVVTAPISLRPRRGAAQPRLMEVRGGLLLNHGEQNPGWRRALERFGAAWERSQSRVIVHLGGHSTGWVDLAKRIEATRGVAGIEVDLTDNEGLKPLAALRAAVELPILVRLPYAGAPLAVPAVQSGADVLVCIAPPGGAALAEAGGQSLTPTPLPRKERGAWIEGQIYGALVKPLATRTLREAAALVTVPLIGAGGLYTVTDAAEMLAAGASAVMVDSLAWVDPAAVNALIDAMAGRPSPPAPLPLRERGA